MLLKKRQFYVVSSVFLFFIVFVSHAKSEMKLIMYDAVTGTKMVRNGINRLLSF
jgi:hypothetical protein